MNSDFLEGIGLIADRLNNAAYGAVIPLPDKMHKEQLARMCLECSNEIKGLLKTIGFNPWDDDND